MSASKMVTMTLARVAVILLVASFIFLYVTYAHSTDNLWLLVLLPFACTVPPVLHGILWRDLTLNDNPVQITGKALMKLILMNCIVFGGAIVVVMLIAAYVIAACGLSSGTFCIIPI